MSNLLLEITSAAQDELAPLEQFDREIAGDMYSTMMEND